MAVSRTPKIFGSSYQPPQSPRTKPILNQSWRAIAIVVVVFIAIVMIGRLPVFRLQSVELVGDQDPSVSQDIASLKGQSIFSHAVGATIINEQNKLSVADFNCRRGLPNALRCSLKLRQPDLIWQSGPNQYLVDTNGKIYAAKQIDSTSLVTVNDTQQQPVRLGQAVASAEVVSSYLNLVKTLQTIPLTVTNLEISESLFQVTANVVRPTNPTPIKAEFILTGDLTVQVAELKAAFEQKSDHISSLVDLRVPGYVYTK